MKIYALSWNVDVSCTKNLLDSSSPSPDQMPGYYAMNEPKHSPGVVVCKFFEKWTGMKNAGLKMPEKDQINMKVIFSYY